MMAVNYQPIVTLGNILQSVGVLLVAVGVYVRVIERLTKVETKLDGLMRDMTTRIEVALFKHRMNKSAGD